MKSLNVALLAAAALSMLAPASARAAAFFIDDTLPSEVIIFSANDFEGGLTLDGNLFQQGNNNPAVATLPEGNVNGPIVHHFDGMWITTGAALPAAVQVAFIEPGTNLLSDVLLVQYIDQGNGFGRMVGSFVSDTSEQGLSPGQYINTDFPVTNWPETNGPFNFSAPFLSAAASSDIEVPEPASFGLLAVGAGALIRRRRGQACRGG